MTIAGIAAAPCASYAAALSTPSMSVSALATANANAAATNDPSAQHYNPASLTRFSGTRVAGAMLAADATIKFQDEGSTTGYDHENGGTPIQGGAAGDPIKPSVIPQTFFTHQVSDQLFLGLAIDVPYAFQGTFNDDWIGRYDGTDQQIAAININPSMAWKFNRQWSVGFGLSAELMSIKETKAFDPLPTLTVTVDSAGNDIKAIAANLIASNSGCALTGINTNNNSYAFDQNCSGSPQAGNQMAFTAGAVDLITSQINNNIAPLVEQNSPENDSEITIEGMDVSFGYNFGVLYQPMPGQTIGLSYRSKIVHEISGDADWTVNEKVRKEALDEIKIPPVAGVEVSIELPVGEIIYDLLDQQLLQDGDFDIAFTLPATASLHSYHQLGKDLAVMADLTWTEWSTFKDVRSTYQGLPERVAVLNFENTLRISLATEYQFSPRLQLKAGFAYDPTPSPAAYRNPTMPDSDRQTFSFGANYRLGKNESIDFGFALLKFKDSRVNFSDYGEGNQPAPLLSVSEIAHEFGLDTKNMQGLSQVNTTTVNNHTTRGTFTSEAYLVGIQYNRKF